MNIVGPISLFLIAIFSSSSFHAEPANACNNKELDSKSYHIGKVIGNKNDTINLLYDYPDICKEKCASKWFLVPGDQILITESYKTWVHAYFRSNDKQDKPREATMNGWLPADRVKILATEKPLLNNWIGTWSDGYTNTIVITEGQSGTLKIRGEASHPSGNEGQIDEELKPLDNELCSEGEDEYECSFWLTLIGPYLVADDNLKCGGFNVSFYGIYIKTNTGYFDAIKEFLLACIQKIKALFL